MGKIETFQGRWVSKESALRDYKTGTGLLLKRREGMGAANGLVLEQHTDKVKFSGSPKGIIGGWGF